jgi:hypothetical protein
MGRKKQVYALYKGDEFIDLGTIEELAKKEGIKPKTMSYFSKPAYKRKFKDDRNRKVLIKIEGD